jgi:phospholipid/cholesterol/gamma-HCH transport system substrate-binding protein
MNKRNFENPVDFFVLLGMAGLLGVRYVGIEPGSANEDLPYGGVIWQTQSAVVLEDLIGELVTGEAAEQAGRKK